MTPASLLAVLAAWRAAGWLRAIDLALAGFVHELAPDAPASLLLGAALSSLLEGRGHSCLPLTAVVRDGELLAPSGAGHEPVPASLPATLRLLPGDAAAARAVWPTSAVLAIDPTDLRGSSPLVLHGDRLYLRRNWRHESVVAAHVRARTAALPGPLDDVGFDVGAARGQLDRLFGGAAAVGTTDWQRIACAVALRGRLTLVTGGPGTGKTHTAARLLALTQALHTGAQPLRVALAAPTGKAAARLRQSIESAGLPSLAALGPARTLHALLGTRPGSRRFVHDAAHPLELDLLFVDEASMVNLEMMAALLDALPAAARIVLLGDRDQLASVESGAVLADLCAPSAAAYRPDTAAWVDAVAGQALPLDAGEHGSDLAQQTVALRDSRRFGGPIGDVAAAVNRGDSAGALDLLRGDRSGTVTFIEAGDAGEVATLACGGEGSTAGGYLPYAEALRRRPAERAGFDAWAKSVLARFDDFRVLCAVRDGDWGVLAANAMIERALGERFGWRRRADWYEGRPVMVTRNDAGLGVFNGDIGVVLASPDDAGRLRVHFTDGETLRAVSIGRLPDVETAFAMTVHKSQGSEFGHVALVLPDRDTPVLTRELVYTGMTRARRALTLVAGSSAIVGAAVERRTRRLGGLGAML